MEQRWRKSLRRAAALLLAPAVLGHTARLRGLFAALDDSGITIRTEYGDVVKPRDDTFRVILLEHSRRLRSALIGASIVGGTALVAGAAARAYGDPETSGIVAPLTLVGAGLGAAIGLGFPRYPTLYVAEKVVRNRVRP